MTSDSYQRPSIPPIHHYWDRPEPRDQGDDGPDPIFLSVGRALSRWESVESVFARTFGLFVESDSSAAIRAYGAITSSSGRREALREAAAVFSDKRGNSFPQDDFGLLMKHYADASARRNEIAHGMVASFNIEDQSRGFFLVPATYNSRKNEAFTLTFVKEVKQSKDQFKVFGHNYRYTSADISHFAALLEGLAQQASGFFMEQVITVSNERFERAPNSQKAAINLGELPTSKGQGSE